jgi:hypothetical protein
MKKTGSFAALAFRYARTTRISEYRDPESRLNKGPRIAGVFSMLVIAALLCGVYPSLSLSYAGTTLHPKASPVVNLSAETVALLAAGGKDHTHLEAVAKVDTGGRSPETWIPVTPSGSNRFQGSG